MVHLEALPGSPNWSGEMGTMLDAARRDAEALAEGGCDAILVENMKDLPYLKGAVYPETVAAMTLATSAVIQETGLTTGVQVLAAANREALGVALAAGADFVRVEAFAYAHVADEGWIDASAGPLLRARSGMKGDHISIWADVQKKHAAHAVTKDLSLEELAHGAIFCGADALIVTGASTGHAADASEVERLGGIGVPVVVGSGVTAENIEHYTSAHAVIVGSWLKRDGNWRAPVDLKRVRALRAARDRALEARVG